MTEKTAKPEIRFKGFSDAWEQRKLSDKFSDFIVPMRDKPKEFCGQIPWTRIEDIEGRYLNGTLSGQYVSHETIKDMNLKIIPKDSLIVSSSATFGVVAIVTQDLITNQTFIGLVPNDRDALDFWYIFFQSSDVRRYMKLESAGSTIFYIARESFEKMPIKIPYKAEMKKIGQYFYKIDNLITLYQRKYDNLMKVKKSMLEKMFPKNGATVPEIRFKGFSDDWEQRKLGDITVESSEYANLEAGYPLFTSSRAGLMYQNEYRGNLTTDSKETLFSVVPVGACTYRHMSDDDVFHLNINTLEKGLVSREYPVFFASEGIRLDFIVQYINYSVSFRAFCAEQKKGGTRTRLYYNALCEFKMMVPSQREQDAIADFFLKLDNLITLHQRKLEKLKNIKKACLEKMFV